MAVNLLPVDHSRDTPYAALKRRIFGITTAVLVIYLVTAAGLGGWWLFLSTRQTQLSQAEIDVATQIAKYANVEVLLRQQADRVANIEQFLTSKVSYAATLQTLAGQASNIAISAWTGSQLKGNVVTVTASSSAALETYATSLKNFFTSASFNSVARKTSDAWEGTITLSHLKP